jgi:hypothetical protein
MESFVPLGGFFSTPSDVKGTLGNSFNNMSRCHVCNEKCDQEVNAISNGGFNASVADRYQSNLPSCLQTSEFSSSAELNEVKVSIVVLLNPLLPPSRVTKFPAA